MKKRVKNYIASKELNTRLVSQYRKTIIRYQQQTLGMYQYRCLTFMPTLESDSDDKVAILLVTVA